MIDKLIKRREIQEKINSLEKENEKLSYKLKNLVKEPNGRNKYDEEGNLVVAYTTQIEIDYIHTQRELELKISSNKDKIKKLKIDLEHLFKAK